MDRRAKCAHQRNMGLDTHDMDQQQKHRANKCVESVQ